MSEFIYDQFVDHIRESPSDLKDRLLHAEIKDRCYPYKPVLLREVYSATGGQWIFHHYDARKDRCNPTDYWIRGEPEFITLIWRFRDGGSPKELKDLLNATGLSIAREATTTPPPEPIEADGTVAAGTQLIPKARKVRRTEKPEDAQAVAEAIEAVAKAIEAVAKAIEAMLIHPKHRRRAKAINLWTLIHERLQDPESRVPFLITNKDIVIHCHNKTKRWGEKELLKKTGEGAIKDTILIARQLGRAYHLPYELEQIAHRGVVVKEKPASGTSISTEPET
jgi:hypothetical protein